MNKQAYRQARRLIRDNGYFAVRWLKMSQASLMLQLKNQREDRLAEKAAVDEYIGKYEHAYSM